ncbi:MAG: hypothetical protein SNJ57_12060 [Cyanobacteriota bacterium]
MPTTHYGFGYAGTLAIVQQQANIHWFLGLRQAEIEISTREQELEYNQRQMRLTERSLKRKTARLNWLRRFAWLGILWPGLYDEIEDLEQHLVDVEREKSRLEPLLRDSFADLELLVALRDRFLEDHKEAIEGKTFQQLQEEFTPVAALEGIAKMVAAEVWARQQNLPGIVGTTLADLTAEQRQYVLQRETELRLGIETSQAIADANKVLSMLPPEQQTEALLMAAHLITQSNELPNLIP